MRSSATLRGRVTRTSPVPHNTTLIPHRAGATLPDNRSTTFHTAVTTL